MKYAALEFNTLPRVGFAHHFHVENYEQNHKKQENSLEIVYVKEGTVLLESGGVCTEVAPGSVAVIFRTMPFSIRAVDGALHRHCSVQLQFDYRLSLLDDTTPPPAEFEGLLLPLILPPCAEAENIRKELYTIVSELGVSRCEREFPAALTALGILARLDGLQRQKSITGNTSSIWEYRIKQYIARHLHTDITLSDIAEALGKTPNYLGSVFRAATGSSILQYINGEKVRRIAEMMETREMPFKTACAAVGITDVAYGYRLFKQYMGVPMRTYLSGEHTRK